MRIVPNCGIAAGDQLVRIDLMAGVPDQPVVAEVERLVQRQAELDDAQVRGEVGAAGRDEVAEHLAHLGGEPLELRQRELLEVVRRVDRRQDGGVVMSIYGNRRSDG